MSEYERNGTANLFIVCEPLIGWRHISITKHRTKLEYWAHCIKEMVDLHYPEAEKIVLVVDNLNIHTPAALYARRSIRPKPDACWRGWRSTTPQRARLLVAEHGRDRVSESSRCCWLASVWSSVSPTGRRSPGEVGALEEERNAAESSIEWRFTATDARIKLKHLYPEIVEEPSYDPNLS